MRRFTCRGATPETVKKAFEILLSDPKVKSIFINIFGGMHLSSHPLNRFFLIARCSVGIMRCDYIAEGVIKATKELQLKIPLVVRLKGTKEAEAKEYVSFTFLLLFRDIHSLDDFFLPKG